MYYSTHPKVREVQELLMTPGDRVHIIGVLVEGLKVVGVLQLLVARFPHLVDNLLVVIQFVQFVLHVLWVGVLTQDAGSQGTDVFKPDNTVAKWKILITAYSCLYYWYSCASLNV